MANLALTQSRLPARGVVLTAPRPAPAGAFLGFVGLVFAALFMGGLTIVASGRMSPLDTTMSDYVFVDGVGWLFPASLLAMCVAGIGVVTGLTARGLLRGTTGRLAMGLTMLGLLLAATFRTDLGDVSVSMSAQIHRYAAGVVFFCVPIAVLAVARELAAPARRSLHVGVLVTLTLLTLFLTCHLGPMPAVLGELSGLIQRLLFVAELVLLAQLVRLIQRPAPQRAHALAG
jgi:hypothetical protein